MGVRVPHLHDEVVDDHGDKVDADSVVASGGLGDEQLGADAVGARHEDWILVACKREKAAEG